MGKHTKLLLSVVLVGCASSVDEGDTGGPSVNLIAFTPMFSAFDGTHDYAVTPSVPSAAPSSNDADPIVASSLKWELEGAFVERDEFPELPGAIKLTTKKAGATIVTVTAKTLSGQAVRSKAKLTISKATPEEWEAGEARYHDNTPPQPRPDDFTGCREGGLRIELPPRTTACSMCHDASSMLSIEHTPTQTAGYSDEDLIRIITEAAKPAGARYTGPFLRTVPMPDCVYETLHRFDLTDEEKKGLIWKLRSIPPKAEEGQRPLTSEDERSQAR